MLYYTNNFYENCGVTAGYGGMVGTGRVEHVHQFSMEQAKALFEELLKMERDKYEEHTKSRKAKKIK